MTAPDNFKISLQGFNTTEDAEAVGEIIGHYTRELSKLFDLSSLDGITVAFDYAKALHDLDRGYESPRLLTPSEGKVVGVAMTPSVIRDRVLKSHIVLCAGLVVDINNNQENKLQQFIQILAHECAHVEVTNRFDIAFPNTLLRHQHLDQRVRIRWDVTLACWDEYAATRLSAKIGRDPSSHYEKGFLDQLNETNSLVKQSINSYQTHGNHNQAFSEVILYCGRLLKLASYYLGNLDGHGVNPLSKEEADKRMHNLWFEPFLKKLHNELRAIHLEYGAWKDQSLFEKIGDLMEDFLADRGVTFHYSSDGALRFNFPR